MHLVVLYFVGHEYGYGHACRSHAFAETARAQGHTVVEISNNLFYTLHGIDDLITILDTGPDVLVIDTPEIPTYIAGLARIRGIKVCLLNGIGHELDYQHADLVWIQDCPERIILRPEFVTTNNLVTKEKNWFVYGGATDRMGLLPQFSKAMPDDSAFLINTHLTGYSTNILAAPHHALVLSTRIPLLATDIIYHMQHSSKAVVGMGMTAWELAALGIPIYVFSCSTGHLRFAQQMAELGLVKVFPEVGVPDVGRLREFIQSDFVYQPVCKPDGLGAERLLRAIKESEQWPLLDQGE